MRLRHPGWIVAALIALALLSYASVRSAVMQVAMAAPGPAAPMCQGAMTAGAMGMAHAGHASPAKGGDARSGAARSCPYCAAAGHPPLAMGWEPPRPSAAVQFVAYRVATLRGARGPPALRPRVRDPPGRPLSL